MTLHDFDDLTKTRRHFGSTSVEHVCKVAKQPRATEATASNDNAITTGVSHHTKCIPGFPDVTVTKHRDLDRLLQLGDRIPVRFPIVELRCSSRVQCDRGTTFLFSHATRVKEGVEKTI